MTADHSTAAPVTYKGIERLPGYRFGDDGSVWSRHGSYGRGFRSEWRKLSPCRMPHHRYPDNPKLTRHRISLATPNGVRNFLVSRLILEAFEGPCPVGKECCHYDGDASNDRLENLRWDTRESNVADTVRLGTFRKARGSAVSQSKLTEEDIPVLRSLRNQGWSMRKIARAYQLNRDTIEKALNGKTWRHVP